MAQAHAHAHLPRHVKRIITTVTCSIPFTDPLLLLSKLTTEQYHAFETIRVCYPSDFFSESLQALGLPHQRRQRPTHHHNPTDSRTDHPSAAGLEPCGKSRQTASVTPAAATSATASSGVRISPDQRTKRKNGIEGAGASGVRFSRGEVRGGTAEHSGKPSKSRAQLLGPRVRSPPLFRRSVRGVETSTGVPRLDPLPRKEISRQCPRCDQGRFDTRRKSANLSPSKHSAIQPKMGSGQASSSTARCLPKEGEGNIYWDLLGTKQGAGTCDGDVWAVVENSEMTKSAVASVVLLRWAMEYAMELGGDGSTGGGSRATLLNKNSDVPRVQVARSRTPSVQGKAMNATVSGPIHLMHAARKPRDSDLFLLSGPLETGDERSDLGRSIARKNVSRIGFASTSPTQSSFSLSCNFERLTDHNFASDQDGGQEIDNCDRSVNGVCVTSPSPGEEPRSNASDANRYAQQVSSRSLSLVNYCTPTFFHRKCI